MRARYYDPATAQFLSVDPLVGLTQSPYGYVGGDPVNSIDPSGLCDSQGNGNAWDVFNPWSSNNPIRFSVQKNPNSTTTHILEGNPAYQAIQHGYNAYQLTQNSCSSNSSIAWQSTQSAFYSALTVAAATGVTAAGSAAVDSIGNLGDLAYGNRVVGADGSLFGNSSLGETDTSGLLNPPGRGAWRLGWSVDSTGPQTVPGFRLKAPGIGYLWLLHATGF